MSDIDVWFSYPEILEFKEVFYESHYLNVLNDMIMVNIKLITYSSEIS